MDELHYRSTYSDINPQRCVFEKAINSRVCNCSKSQRFNLADREGVACQSKDGLQRCEKLIKHLHENARFTLQRLDVDRLGHAQEIKIQNGGLLGLQIQLTEHSSKNVEDVNAIVVKAQKKYKVIENFPFSKIVQVISAYQIRSKRKTRK
ncbi:MAG: hypothetical protein AAF304_00630 [Pseudomonadota bacterium]